MVVYADLVFLIGVLIHGVTATVCLKMMDLFRKRRRIVWYSLIGGAVSVLMLFPHFPFLIGIGLSLAVPVLFFRGKTVRGTMRNCLGYACILFSFVACFFGVGTVLMRGELVGGYLVLPFSLSVAAVFLSGATVAVPIIRKKHSAGNCVECEIGIDGRRIPVRCFCDTGNFLRDPVSGLPVVIVEYAYLCRFIPDLPPPLSFDFATRFGTRYRVVTCRSVSGDGQILASFLPENFFVCGEPRQVLVSVCERNLENRGRFSGLIGSESEESL